MVWYHTTLCGNPVVSLGRYFEPLDYGPEPCWIGYLSTFRDSASPGDNNSTTLLFCVVYNANFPTLKQWHFHCDYSTFTWEHGRLLGRKMSMKIVDAKNDVKSCLHSTGVRIKHSGWLNTVVLQQPMDKQTLHFYDSRQGCRRMRTSIVVDTNANSEIFLETSFPTVLKLDKQGHSFRFLLTAMFLVSVTPASSRCTYTPL